MSSQGFLNWKRNFQSAIDGQELVIKSSGNIYIDPYGNRQATDKRLIIGNKVIYDYNSSLNVSVGNAKIGFKFLGENTIYYSSVENFSKPGENRSLDASYFGLSGKTFTDINLYKNTLFNNIVANNEISSDLKNYLLALVEYCYKQETAKFNASINNINFTNFNWGSIRSYFTELIGPLACISGLCTKFPSGFSIDDTNVSIYIETNSAPQIDYKIIKGDSVLSISAKSGNTSPNTIKPKFVVKKLIEIKSRYITTPEFKVLSLLDKYTIKTGPIFAINYIFGNLIPENNLKEILSLYDLRSTSNAVKIDDDKKTKLTPFFTALNISNQQQQNLSYGKFRKKCEDKLVNWSKEYTHVYVYRLILRKYVEAQDIILVKSYINKKDLPKFEVAAANKIIIDNSTPVYLKNKNQDLVTQDKIGLVIG